MRWWLPITGQVTDEKAADTTVEDQLVLTSIVSWSVDNIWCLHDDKQETDGKGFTIEN